MIDVAFAIPGDLGAATGGYAYARRVFQLLPQYHVTPHHLELPGSFPDPSHNDLMVTLRLLEQIHPHTPIFIDGLAFGALPPGFLDDIEPPVIGLVHHPLALESGIALARKRQLIVSERCALARAEAVVATSHLTARVLRHDYDVPATSLVVAEPGTEPAGQSLGTGAPFTMLAVGALIPRKGYNVLIKALGQLDHDNWMLTIVGSPDHDPVEANRIRKQILASGLRRRITLAGRVPADQLEQLYKHADLFVMPSYYEGYGMVLGEAMARGVAIVCTTGGAAVETAPDEAALKVEPGNAPALAAAINRMMSDKTLLEAKRKASWEAGQRLPRWSESVDKIAGVIKATSRRSAL